MRFEVTKAGRKCSDIGGNLLANLAQCQLGAETIGKVYKNNVNWKVAPKGCILSVQKWNLNKVFWNTYNGAKHDGYAAICKKDGKYYIDRHSINVYYTCRKQPQFIDM